MKFILWTLIIVIIFLIYLLFKNHSKSTIITIICSLIILQIVFEPKLCINFTISGAKLFFYSVFPSLFPFLVICNMMINCGGVHIYSNMLGKILCRPLRLPNECSIVIIISALCGYPLGAKYTCDLYEKNIIDYDTAQRLLNIASNPSPIFIIGAVGTSMLNKPHLGYIIMISCYISCIIMSFILPVKKNINKTTVNNIFYEKNQKNLGIIFKESIDNALATVLYVGGFIIIFSVITNIIKRSIVFKETLAALTLLVKIPTSILSGTSIGLLEMTNGCYMLSLPLYSNFIVCIIGFLVCFSGLCVILQVYSFIYKYKFSLGKYSFYKFIQGIVCSAVIIFILSVIR